MGEFEKDLLKLEQISQQLQSGEIGIEKSMALYADGVKLANALIDKIETYKSKIEILENGVKE